MEFTDEEKITIQSYDKYAKDWTLKYSVLGFWEQEMMVFQKFLPEGRMLEIGSGGGRDARELIELGYDYVGVDVSDSFLCEARKENPNALFLKQSAYNLGFKDNSFNGFWSSATLLHIPRNKINLALQEIHRVISSSGVGFIAMTEGSLNGMHKTTLRAGDECERYFTCYLPEEFWDILENNGYKIIYHHTRQINEDNTWLVYMVRVEK